MKNNAQRTEKKRTALWLSLGCVLCLLVFCFNAVCVFAALRGEVYTKNPQDFTKTILTGVLQNRFSAFYNLCDAYESIHFPQNSAEQSNEAELAQQQVLLRSILDAYDPASTNLRYRITRAGSEILNTVAENEEALVSAVNSYRCSAQTKYEQKDYKSAAERDKALQAYLNNYTVLEYQFFDTAAEREDNIEKTFYTLDIWYCEKENTSALYEITLLLPAPAARGSVTDIYSVLCFSLNAFVALRFVYPVLAALALLALLVFFVVLLCRRAPKSRRIDRVPYLLLFAPYAVCAVYGTAAVLSCLGQTFFYDILAVCIGTALFGITLWMLLRTVRRIQLGLFWRTTLLFYCLRLLRYLFMHIPAFWKLLLVGGAFILLQGASVLLVYEGSPAGILLWLLLQSAWLGFGIYLVLCWNCVKAIGSAAASGETAEIPHWLLPEFQKHAAVLSDNASRIAQAVSAATKSERLKAELITNVSHDIKTPLTSIVNYTDLLQKEGLQSPNAAEYLAVLQRQSIRLKKLTEDLIEASRAASGCVAVHAQPLDLGVMLLQELGEYKERFESAGLTVVEEGTQTHAPIAADPTLLGRIFDNLLGNICKYAMPGTRVYFSLERTETHAVLILRNIAKEAPANRGEELLERFVRGDHARTTQGSGLGLSIAQSLCTLQGGTLQLKIDGDLFKVILRFPFSEKTEQE